MYQLPCGRPAGFGVISGPVKLMPSRLRSSACTAGAASAHRASSRDARIVGCLTRCMGTTPVRRWMEIHRAIRDMARQ
ncbi:hypothetical protein G6F50_015901 [Rhizopus delemar]|uniref:Uncharacterized protein n=1 Tax=Rhizopus delemar TaxID=936053 RepID=A0A9P7C2D9_9FUNG|nr:hypothetical protein G6F50_015901 [Rhizopus delemar]